MHLSYQYRIYPRPSQEATLESWRKELGYLWNFALAQRKDAWEREHRPVSYLDQQESLATWRSFDARGLGQVRYVVAQNLLQELDLAYRSFFRRVKDGERRPGYPRFKKDGTVRSFRFNYADTYVKIGTSATDRRVRLSGIGCVPIVVHREPPADGKLLTATVSREADRWLLTLVYELPDPAPPPPPEVAPANPVGIDLGIMHPLALSTGEVVEPLRPLEAAEERLKREQRRLARKEKGSNNHRKQAAKVARCHQRVADRRKDLCHKLTSRIAREHDLVAVEALNVPGMVRGPLAKAILDAPWGRMRSMLEYKLAMRSGRYVEVDPRGTTQTCSMCGRVADPPLSLGEREFACPCGHREDRDVNAARNVLHRGCDSVRRMSSEVKPAERTPPPRTGGRRVYRGRRATSRNQEDASRPEGEGSPGAIPGRRKPPGRRG
ncbi:MAG: transposase [Euryarchaeota archaeon]|nr:transposase [Euryarchaeota archaeon]